MADERNKAAPILEYWETFGLNAQYWEASKRELIKDQTVLSYVASQDLIYAFSDYSGGHKKSKLMTFVVALIGANEFSRWLILCKEMRIHYRLRDRTISYKSMNDGVRRRAMPEILSVVRSLPMLFVVFNIEKSIRPVFGPGYPEFGDKGLTDPVIKELIGTMRSEWKSSVAEKAFLVCHLLCFAYQFVSKPHQTFHWLSDEDDFCLSDDQVKLLHDMCRLVSPGYARFPLGKLGIATTRGDKELRVEDGVALADLVAGAINEAMNAYAEGGELRFFRDIFTLPNRGISSKSIKIIKGLFLGEKPIPLLNLIAHRGSKPGSRASNVLSIRAV